MIGAREAVGVAVACTVTVPLCLFAVGVAWVERIRQRLEPVPLSADEYDAVVLRIDRLNRERFG